MPAFSASGAMETSAEPPAGCRLIADDDGRVADHDRVGRHELVTTAPAPTIAVRPMRMPGRMVALAPIDAPSWTIVCAKASGYSFERGKMSLVKVAFGPMKTLVAHPHAVPQLDAALDRDAVADDHVVLDEDVVADVAVAADACARQHMGEGPDARAGADLRAFAESRSCTKTPSVRSWLANLR